MSKKDKGIFWSSTASKPKGFNFVKGEFMTYTYKVPIVANITGSHSWNNTEIDNIFIKVKIKNSGEPGYAFTVLDIDKDYANESIKKEVGQGVQFEYEDHCFMRDRSMFPFITSITIYFDSVEKYKQHRFLKARKEKLEKLRIKING